MDNNKKRNPSASTQNPLICALVGGGISIAVIVLTALLFPFVALKFGDPNAAVLPICIVCAIVGGCLGGFVSAKMCGEFMIRVGLMSSGITVVPMILVSLVTIGKIDIVSALAIIFSIVLSSLLGAYFVMKMSGNKNRNIKKVMKRRG